MSDIYDRTKDVDAKTSTILQALNKKINSGPVEPPPDPPVQQEAPEKKNGGGFSLAIFSLFVMMAVVVAAVFVFSSRTIDKVGTSSRIVEQLAVLADTQGEELEALQDHVTALEAEFRRAFKKDREQIVVLEKSLADLSAKFSSEILRVQDSVSTRLRDEFQNEILKQKTALADQEARTAKAVRDSEDLIKRFDNIQNEFSSLRAKIFALTAPEVK